MKVLDQQCADIRIAASIGSVANFLNVHLKNIQGRLLTRVYHDPNVPPFVLPYAVGHARLMHSNWFRAALVRAVRFCSTVEDFNQERIHTELTFLANAFRSPSYNLAFSRSTIFHPFRCRSSSDRYGSDEL